MARARACDTPRGAPLPPASAQLSAGDRPAGRVCTRERRGITTGVRNSHKTDPEVRPSTGRPRGRKHDTIKPPNRSPPRQATQPERYNQLETHKGLRISCGFMTLHRAHGGNSAAGKSSALRRAVSVCSCVGRRPIRASNRSIEIITADIQHLDFSIEEVFAVLDVVQLQRPSFRDRRKINRRISHPERIVQILQNGAGVEVHETLQMGGRQHPPLQRQDTGGGRVGY